MMILIITHSLILNAECATAEQGAACPPVHEGVQEALGQMTQGSPSQDPPAETKSISSPKEEPTPMSQQTSENMEVEKEDKHEASPSDQPSQELAKSGSDDITDSFSDDPQTLPGPLVSVDKIQLLPMDDKQERSPCQEPPSPSTLSLSVDIEGRLLTQSEEDEDDDYDEQMKEEGHIVDIKQELQEAKPDSLLDETSNMSHGDESSSGFLGSPGEPDSHLSMDLDLIPAGRSHTDNLLTETDDSLPFEPLRSDREKAKRRGSPGRSRVKQVRSPCTSWSDFI